MRRGEYKLVYLQWTIYANYLKVLAKCAGISIIDLEDHKKGQIKKGIDDMLKSKL